ncbi:hypothetical protein LCI18_005996 [Fusarium solani-melongenae]|uniref:Uncharacterized protein n=1 Tax=Fusarium solani subsp. cucurbitae TaxID=2747967 RepID=A0ACD3Z2I5_FUSSC|nr:hypothetical protein LCI18_005996 [Fusarium solani-melongenae]
MASMEPSEDEIGQVIDFAGLDPVDDRFMVAQALKHNNRNAETVLTQFFDNPDNFRQKYQTAWDESMFAADRDGTDNSAGISFHIESSDHDVIQGVTPPPDSYALGAPSRPPSRSNNRSPLGRMVELTAAQVPGTTLAHNVDNALTRTAGVPNSHAQEEDDVQRALRESAQEAGITLPQDETGLTEPSASLPYFGPAVRSDYDQNSWAMVPVGPAKESSPSDPPPSKRKRAPGAPAFLVLSNFDSGGHKLGGLLTILHEIPIARNVLLGLGTHTSSYGHRNDWWKGQEILSPEVQAKMLEELRWEHRSHNETAFDEEVHRLMAFLDGTERAYGSASVLTELFPEVDRGIERKFYDLIDSRHGDQTQAIMQLAVLGKFHEDGDSDLDEVKFGLLDIDLSQNEDGCSKTLYEALDHIMWSDALGYDGIHAGSKMAFFKETGEVLALNIGGDGPGDSIEIPQELYLERYLPTRKDEAKRIQRAWRQTKREVRRIETQKEQIYRLWDDWDHGKYDDKRVLLKKATEQWGEYRSYLEGLARFQAMENSGLQTDKYPDYRAAPCQLDGDAQKQHEKVAQVIEYSEQLLANLEIRMKGLDAELEQIVGKQRALGRLLTVPDRPGRPKPMTCKKYLLRGVATTSNIVYVCRRGEADLIELDDEAKTPSDQWWRMAYTPGEEQPVKVEKIEIERVFRDMWQETKTPLLVYATDEALNTPMSPLPSQLERFVKAENKTFHQELNQERNETSETKRATFVDPISPSKRKHRADSVCSMDSNRASLGSDDRNGFDNPFEDQDDAIGTEMTEFGNPPDHAHSFDASQDTLPATIPQPASALELLTEAASATMTPSTVGADRVESSPAKSPPAVTEESRAPEMQERARPPAFMTLPANSSAPTTKKENGDLMDMEIPEH